jgi:hypothetical protein
LKVGIAMDQTVIITIQPERKYTLLSFLATLFPDCQIEVVLSETEVENRDAVPAGSLPANAGGMGSA